MLPVADNALEGLFVLSKAAATFFNAIDRTLEEILPLREPAVESVAV